MILVSRMQKEESISYEFHTTVSMCLLWYIMLKSKQSFAFYVSLFDDFYSKHPIICCALVPHKNVTQYLCKLVALCFVLSLISVGFVHIVHSDFTSTGAAAQQSLSQWRDR